MQQAVSLGHFNYTCTDISCLATSTHIHTNSLSHNSNKTTTTTTTPNGRPRASNIAHQAHLLRRIRLPLDVRPRHQPQQQQLHHHHHHHPNSTQLPHPPQRNQRIHHHPSRQSLDRSKHHRIKTRLTIHFADASRTAQRRSESRYARGVT